MAISCIKKLDKGTQIQIGLLSVVLLGFLLVPFFVSGTLQPENLSKEAQTQNLARLGAVVVNTDATANPIVTAAAPAATTTAPAASTDYTPENPAALSAEQLAAAENVYNVTCAACHATGLLNAVKFGDGDAWKARLAASGGFAASVKNGINGINAMPAKGGATISDDEFAHVVQYMIEKSGVTP